MYSNCSMCFACSSKSDKSLSSLMGLACEYNQLSTLIAARHIFSEEQGEMAVLAGCIVCFARKILENLETIQNHVFMAEIAVGKLYKTFCPPQVAVPESENV